MHSLLQSEYNTSLSNPFLAQRRRRIRNNLDRYGFSDILADQLGLPLVPRAFSDWIHGWSWWDEHFQVHDIESTGQRKDIPIVLATKLQMEKAKEFGFTNVQLGGLPICYVKALRSKRDPDALLAFVEHTAESEKFPICDLRFLDFLADIRHGFSRVCVSVYALDRDKVFLHEIRKRNLIPILGADPYDRNSMLRTRQMLEHFGHVTGNCMGSFIAYAFFFGANVSLFSPLFQRDPRSFLDSSADKHPDRAAHLEYICSEDYSRRKYGDLFGHPRDINNANRGRGEEYVGYKFKLLPNEVKRILGWSFSDQIKHSCRGAFRRIHRASMFAPREG